VHVAQNGKPQEADKINMVLMVDSKQPPVGNLCVAPSLHVLQASRRRLM
jgi:hypothetical protein